MIPNFHRALRAWFRKRGRDLPWRRRCDPYAVLVSEFMLQQTTVAAVIPYFERWMKAFPDVQTLARADEQEVLSHWQGLGYYSRGRNLLLAARESMERFEGAIPRDVPSTRKLPGVGPYTAAAVAAFAFDECLPVLDANIIRVVARLADFKKPVTTAAGKLFLEKSARNLLPESGGRIHTSALMDLGATVCKAGDPDCSACPVRRFCKAERPEKIPVKPPRKMVIHERDVRGFATKGQSVYLTLSPGPRWRGLWLLPPAKPGAKVLITITFA
ncbi:MAG: A/G-specific adenine glycosylase, partial [Verrucomicrobiaceae bacterium]